MANLTSQVKTKKLFSTNNRQLLIAADCAKAEHVIHFFDCTSGEYVYRKPFKIKNDLAGFKFFNDKAQIVLKKFKLNPADVDFILEDPASYSQNFIHYLQQEGFNVRYVNAQQASRYRENSRASSDTLDLDGIVRAAIMGHSHPTEILSSIYTRIKESSRERGRLIKEQTRHKNSITTQIDKIFPGFLNKKLSGIQAFSKGSVELMLHKDFSPQLFRKASLTRLMKIISKAGLIQAEEIAIKLKELALNCLDVTESNAQIFAMRSTRIQQQLELFKSRQDCISNEDRFLAQMLQMTPYALLTSIVGAGIITIAVIAGELGDPAKLLKGGRTSDQTASYAGVVPRQKQSGGSGKAPVTSSAPKAANRRLKNALMIIVDVARKNQHCSYQENHITHPLKAYFDKLALRDASSYSATAKKLVRIMMAMLKNETIYLPDSKTSTPQDYAYWMEAGTAKMLQKWQVAGIMPTDENALGKWLKNQEAILAVIDH